MTFDRRARWLAPAVSTVAFAVYIATLAPGLTFAHFGADGGDLIAAARNLGVPHPPGYPTYTLLAWLFTHLPVGSVAYRVNLLSAVCAAGAVGILARIAQLLLPPADEYPLVLWGATALTLAFSPLLWSQAVITEVYTLHTLFAALLLWCLVRWRHNLRDRYLWLAAFSMGLGLGNHLTLVFAAPAVIFWLWPYRQRWLNLRTILPAVGLFLAGLCVYAYLPLAAAHDPPVNWGNPRTWQGFVWVITAEQYHQFAFGLPADRIAGRFDLWTQVIGQQFGFGDQFGWWGLMLALAGAASWWQRDRRFVISALAWVLPLGLYSFFYRMTDSYTYILPAMLFLALWWGEGARRLLHLVHRATAAVRPRRQKDPKPWSRVRPRVVLFLIVLLPLVSLVSNWQAIDLRDDDSAHAYISQILDHTAPGALVIVRRDSPTFALWYALTVEGRRADIAVINGRMLAFSWYREQVEQRYPHVIVPQPTVAGITTDDLVHTLIADNYTRSPVYVTDPTETWRERFDLAQMGDAPLYRVQRRPE